MGIKDFYKQFKLKYPECFIPVSYSEFSYKKIAIDMMNLAYVYKSRNEKDWLKLIIEFLLTLRKFYVHPICVFDGQSHPLKKYTVEKRKNDRNRSKNRLEQLKKCIDVYKNTNVIEPDLQKFIDCKNEFVSKFTGQLFTNRIIEYIDKQYKNYNIHFRTTEITELKNIISDMGICVLTAEYDGEALCSYLSALDKVEAVISNDSDVFFFGCKKVIFKYTNNGGYLVKLDSILEKLKFDWEQFVEFCLLCGTDFNTPIKGIGFCKAYNIICEYKTLKNENSPIFNQLDHELIEKIRLMSNPKEHREKVFYSKIIEIAKLNNVIIKNQVNIKLNDFVIPHSLIQVEE